MTDAADDLSTAGADLSATDAPAFDTGLQSCAKHVDCKQGRFCYYGKCLLDGEQPVYHCGKSGCPPGQWCVDQAGQRGVCAESNVYVCADACDCGPAHCCKGGVCVKDVADPWSPGGTAINGLSCERGKDATYCCESPVCHVAQQAYGILVGSFRC